MIRRPSIIHYNRKRRIRRTKLINAVYHTDIKRELMATSSLTVLTWSDNNDKA